MTTPQLINTIFELLGVALALHNISVALRTRPAGVSLPMVAFSALWALEACWYYFSHWELIAAYCASLRCVLVLVWLVLATRPEKVS